MNQDLHLRSMQPGDAKAFASAFESMRWSKLRSLFDGYIADEAAGLRWTQVAEMEGTPAGYVTVTWKSTDPEFAARGIPEVIDLNVLPAFRRRGAGSALLDAAEELVARRHRWVGLRVGLHPGYGAAQRLYVRRGFVPDGLGILQAGVPADEGSTVLLDDDVTLRMTKSVSRGSASAYLRDLRDALGSRLLLIPAVAVVLHDPQGRLLLVQDRTSGEWGLPAGAIEPGESPESAARRELKEETGIHRTALRLVSALGGAGFRHTYANGDRVEYALFVYAGAAPALAEGHDPEEIDRVRFFARAEAPPIRLAYPLSVLWP